ncbi:unnamed protein product [Mytilus coruscus]|uniref:Endonuclease/exonuclease/phosphatase domain-containing protein n=1 Tax=Mytilus coruscus TaxID=42192 RepID=A0A6J8C6W2_MYTCO|nr:unnamed protein product [Mytilus coruscus]
MRSFLEENGIRYTFLRFFNSRYGSSFSAQLNVVCNDSRIVLDRAFWPTGIRIDSKYKIYAKSVDEILPTTQKCSNYRKGVALLVSSNIDRYVVHEIDVDSDRIIGIKMHLPNDVTIFFFCVYLPAASLSVELFKEYVDLLHELYSVYSQNGIVIFAGDFNAKVQGPRVSVVQDDRSKLLRRVLDKFSLISLNTQNFLNELRRVYDEYVADMSNDIEKSIDVDQHLAWCIINSRRSRNTSDILLKLNNRLVNDPKSVCAEFANLFEAIAKTSDHTEDKVNIKLLNHICNRCDNDPIRPVYFEELSKLVIDLPNGKACGLDGISYEHRKYGGKLLLRH